jgi:hypothetical protein
VHLSLTISQVEFSLRYLHRSQYAFSNQDLLRKEMEFCAEDSRRALLFVFGYRTTMLHDCVVDVDPYPSSDILALIV